MAKVRTVEFSVDGPEASGYLAEPEEGGSHPGLIIVHEWWGLNDHIKDVAGRFADSGYVVLAPDLYDGKVTKDPDQAGRLMQGLNQEQAISTLNAAVSFLQSQKNVNGEKIGITGFCMGGSFALLLASVNEAIKASVPFYGDVPEDSVLAELSAPVLFIGAENDFWITRDKIDRLRNALSGLGKEGEVKVYPGVGHAFFNDTRPDAYDAQAAKDAWKRANEFLDERLK